MSLSLEEARALHDEVPVYVAHFQRAFTAEANRDRAAEALAAFVRSLQNGASPWDRYEAGQTDAVSPGVIAGSKIFNERAGCATCHPPPFYTNMRFHSLAVAVAGSESPDPGRALVTKKAEDQGAFKTPGLRGVMHSAPYFHNGSAKTLDEVLDVMEASGNPKLSAEERASLLLFLAALSPEPESIEAPVLP